MNHKVYIIVGHYGSGKSEFAVNFAKVLNRNHLKVCLADLDVVNPYFRSREVREQLISSGIEVVSDTLNSTQGLDMPYLSPAIKGAIAIGDKTIILDCGGDNVGTRVLAQFYSDIVKREYEVLMVINTYRPETSNALQIIEMKDTLEKESKLKVSGFINNSNFLKQTTVEDVVKADIIVKEVSQITGLPIIYVSGIKGVIDALPEDVSGERLVLDLSLRSKWMM